MIYDIIYIIFHMYMIYVCVCITHYLPLTKKRLSVTVLSTLEPHFLLCLKVSQSKLISALRNSYQSEAC